MKNRPPEGVQTPGAEVLAQARELMNDSLEEFSLFLAQNAPQIKTGSVFADQTLLPTPLSEEDIQSLDGMSAVVAACRNHGFRILSGHTQNLTLVNLALYLAPLSFRERIEFLTNHRDLKYLFVLNVLKTGS